MNRNNRAQPKRGCQLPFGSLLLLGIGLIFLVAGGALAIFGARQATAEADRAERLAPLGIETIDDSRPGREALVEGRIGARNQPLFQDFVAYVREEYRGDEDDKEKWVEDERRTPPLQIELKDGIVELADDQYTFDNPPHRWQEPGGLTWNGFSGEGTKRYSGFWRGDAVVAIGTLVEGSEGLELRAERVFGGTRAGYIAARRSAAAFLPWFGGGFALLGAVVAGLGVWLLRRR